MFKAYCINLARRADRWQYMTDLAARHSFQLVRIDAVDATDPAQQALIDAMIQSGPCGTLGKGALCCTLSHAKAWRQFLETTDDYAVILEDDIIVSDDFETVVALILAAKPGLDLVKIECGGSAARGLLLGPALSDHAGRSLRACHQLATDAAGYILSRKGARVALQRYMQCDVGVDHFLFYPKQRKGGLGLAFGIISPTIVIQDRSMNSDISMLRHKGSTYARRLKRAPYEVAPVWQMLKALASGARVVKSPFVQSLGKASAPV